MNRKTTVLVFALVMALALYAIAVVTQMELWYDMPPMRRRAKTDQPA